MTNETLSSGVVQIGDIFEGRVAFHIGNKLTWVEYSKIQRLTMENAKMDALRMIEDYKLTNQIN